MIIGAIIAIAALVGMMSMTIWAFWSGAVASARAFEEQARQHEFTRQLIEESRLKLERIITKETQCPGCGELTSTGAVHLCHPKK